MVILKKKLKTQGAGNVDRHNKKSQMFEVRVKEGSERNKRGRERDFWWSGGREDAERDGRGKREKQDDREAIHT